MIFRSLKNSFKGLYACFQKEKSFRLEVIVLGLIYFVCLCLPFTVRAYLEVLASFFLVLITELLNTSLEKIADRVTKEFDPIIGYAKDVSSAAVFLSIVLALIILFFQLLSL